MLRKNLRKIVSKLFCEIEEEDVGISLFTTFYQDQDELQFFNETERGRVKQILKILSDDSKEHKRLLEEAIGLFGKKGL